MRLDREAGAGILLTYPTPILNHLWPEAGPVNAGLKRLLLGLEQQHPEYKSNALQYSNHGGWRSLPDLLDRSDPEIATLKGWIGQACDTMMQLAFDPAREKVLGEYRAVAWANINRSGAYHVVHQHADNHWSGVYYVSVGEPDAGLPLSGAIEFQDPRPVTYMSPIPGFEFGHKFAVSPQDGMMLLFPSWHSHFVHPYVGKGPRITISFNVRVTDFHVLACDKVQ